MPPTLEEIARHAGVAKSTVSMTLRNHPRASRFSEETRQRILEVAERLAYRPNFFAAALSSSQRRLLMLGLSHLGDTWASRVAAGFEQEASEQGYRTLITAFQQKEDPVAFNREILGAQGVPALAVVGGTRTKFTDEAVRQLADEGVKIVTVNRRIDHPDVSEIVVDDRCGARLAANHLYDCGVEHLWVVARVEQGVSLQVELRVQGAIDAARERGKPEPRLVGFAIEGSGMEDACRAMTDALKEGRPDGVFAVGDLYAVGVCHALRDHGMEIGRDVPVVGFDGGIYSVTHYPQLTSVIQPMLEMGKMAARLLRQAMEDPGYRPQKISLEPELAIRASTRMGG